MSLKDEILAAEDIEIRPIEVPEWGFGKDRPLHLKTITVKQQAKIAAKISRDGRAANTSPDYLAASICDESGNLLFTDPKDIEQLNGKSSRVVERILGVVLEMNGLGESEEEAKGN